MEDKWSALRAYRRAKGLCFTCGDRWGKDHVCKQVVPLHIVQEMVEFCQLDAVSDASSVVNDGQLMALSAKSFQLSETVQGHNLQFLIDSGSTHSFLDNKLASQLQGVVEMPSVVVKVADGATLVSNTHIPDCEWSVAGHRFQSRFRLLDLGCYDGIIGLDWLV